MLDFCCQIFATRDFGRPETLILCGFQDFGPYSHSMQSNVFSLIFISPVRSRDSDSTDYLYSPCSTASVYHFFISVIKRLFCCGLRGLFPWNYYTAFLIIRQETIFCIAFTTQRVLITCLFFYGLLKGLSSVTRIKQLVYKGNALKSQPANRSMSLLK